MNRTMTITILTFASLAVLEACGQDASSWPPASSSENAMLANIANGKYGPTAEEITPAGMDPGLKKKKALFYTLITPDNPATPQSELKDEYHWLCPPGEPCDPAVKGSGYYNLYLDRLKLKVNTPGGTHYYTPADDPTNAFGGANVGLATPLSFKWSGPEKYADTEFKSTHLSNWQQAGDPYVGLQINLPGQTNEPPGGHSEKNGHLFPIASIRYVHLKMRSLACLPPKAREPYTSGRVVLYLSGYNTAGQGRPNGALGVDFAINLGRFMSTPSNTWGTGGIAAPGRARWECHDMNLFAHPTCGTSAIDIDGPSWSLGKATDLNVFRQENCTSDAIEAQPFVDYVIDFPRLLVRLIDEGFFTVAWLKDAKYVGSALGGMEIFGPADVRTQVASHSIYIAKNPIDLGTLVSGIRTGLKSADPGFLADVNTFVYREGPRLDATTCARADCTCPASEGTQCNTAATGREYGKVCSTGGKILACTNATWPVEKWQAIASATPCVASIAAGVSCTLAGQSCRSGDKTFICSDRGYSGPGYAPESTPIGSTPAPPAPGSLGEGNYQLPNSAKYYFNGTNGWCWFNALSPKPALPLQQTTREPQTVGTMLDRNRGQCDADAAASGTATPPSRLPVGYYRLNDSAKSKFQVTETSWCWFHMLERPGGAALIDTTTPPQSSGVSGGARCSWDVLEGNYILASGAKYYYNGERGWCWYAYVSPRPALPLQYTTREAQTLGTVLSRNGGRCDSDL